MAAFIKTVGVCLVLLSCDLIKPVVPSNDFQNLEEYKNVTEHIIRNNYHKNFHANVQFERSDAPDNVISKFMETKQIRVIRSIGVNNFLSNHNDSIIEYHFSFTPIFGKRKELRFDFSSNPPKDNFKKNGVKRIILEKGIYYLEY